MIFASGIQTLICQTLFLDSKRKGKSKYAGIEKKKVCLSFLHHQCSFNEIFLQNQKRNILLIFETKLWHKRVDFQKGKI